MIRFFFTILVLFISGVASASNRLQISLSEAQASALENSVLIKAAISDVTSFRAQENAGKAALYPRLSLQGTYSYALTLPEVSLAPNSPKVVFGDHNNYSFGPSVGYTLWDNFGSIRAYESLKKMRQSGEQAVTSTKNQLLRDVRSAYVKSQLALEELDLCYEFLKLAQKQKDEVQARERDGAASRVDLVLAERQVIMRELQCQQSHTHLGLMLKDLLALIHSKSELNLARPGSVETRGNTLTVALDTLQSSLDAFNDSIVSKPDESHPLLHGQELAAAATDLSAKAQESQLYPRLEMRISASVAYPNGPELVHHFQNAIGLSLTMPLYFGDPSWDLIEQKKSGARSIRLRAYQLNLDLQRDYEKATMVIENLKAQKAIAKRDLEKAKELLRLFQESFAAGKVRLLDVYAADTEAMNAAVNLKRIDAQILQQIFNLISISGKDFFND